VRLANELTMPNAETKQWEYCSSCPAGFPARDYNGVGRRGCVACRYPIRYDRNSDESALIIWRAAAWEESAISTLRLERKFGIILGQPFAPRQTQEWPTMAHRTFTDAQGDGWEVFDAAFPAAQRALAEHFPPWLCFESENEKRRLSPIPEGWQNASTQELQRLLSLATIVIQTEDPAI
jgi:hypothetical protein